MLTEYQLIKLTDINQAGCFNDRSKNVELLGPVLHLPTLQDLQGYD